MAVLSFFPACSRQMRWSTLVVAVAMSLLTGCGSLGGSAAHGTFTTRGVEYGISVSKGKFVEKTYSFHAPAGRSVWYVDVEITNKSDSRADFFLPAVSFAVPGSETEVTPARIDQGGLVNTRVPASCKLNGVRSTLSQETKTTYITTETFKGIPHDLCVFSLVLDGIRDEKNDNFPLDPGETRTAAYASRDAFVEGDFPDMKYFVAEATLFSKASSPFKALDS